MTHDIRFIYSATFILVILDVLILHVKQVVSWCYVRYS